MRRARATGVLALGVLALHELSFVVTGGEPASVHAGHAYLAAAVPVVVMLATVLLAVSMLAPLGGGPLSRGSLGPLSRTLLYAGLLLGAFLVQELLEGLLEPASAHPLEHVLGPGAIVALPLALALGAVAALATRGLEGVEGLLAAVQALSPPRPRRSRRKASRPAHEPPRLRAAGASLAFGFARRPPPLTLPA